MKKIQFVCHGNICRSPMAETVMKHVLQQKAVEDVFVASSAASREEIGNPIYPPAAYALRQKGYSPDSHKRARQFTLEDYRECDRIYVMDSSNLSRIRRLTDGDPQGKIFRLMDAVGIGGDVEDPWYTNDFNGVLSQIETACEILAKRLSFDSQLP